MSTKNGRFWKSLLAGAAGGLAAAYAMDQFQAAWTAVETRLAEREGKPQKSSEGGDDATVKTAQSISDQVFHHKLTDSEKKWAGPAVHYAFGTLVGATYGVLAETVPEVASGRGTAYGTAVWLGADEIGVSALGLGQPPTETAASAHIQALAAHLVYGFTTDLVRRTFLGSSS